MVVMSRTRSSERTCPQRGFLHGRHNIVLNRWRHSPHRGYGAIPRNTCHGSRASSTSRPCPPSTRARDPSWAQTGRSMVRGRPAKPSPILLPARGSARASVRWTRPCPNAHRPTSRRSSIATRCARWPRSKHTRSARPSSVTSRRSMWPTGGLSRERYTQEHVDTRANVARPCGTWLSGRHAIRMRRLDARRGHEEPRPLRGDQWMHQQYVDHVPLAVRGVRWVPGRKVGGMVRTRRGTRHSQLRGAGHLEFLPGQPPVGSPLPTVCDPQPTPRVDAPTGVACPIEGNACGIRLLRLVPGKDLLRALGDHSST
jgi:hypothetical protein